MPATQGKRSKDRGALGERSSPSEHCHDMLTLSVNGLPFCYKSLSVMYFIMKSHLLVLTILVGFVTAPVQAKKAWNGPDLHGVNTEATLPVIHESPQSNPE